MCSTSECKIYIQIFYKEGDGCRSSVLVKQHEMCVSELVFDSGDVLLCIIKCWFVSDPADEKKGSSSIRFHNFSRKESIPEDEIILRERSFDYKHRYCGHCNTTTDIKEANFFGRSVLTTRNSQLSAHNTQLATHNTTASGNKHSLFISLCSY